jgi:type IV pilus assembly protein PilM
LALGLALGESGKGEFDIELLAAEKKGMLGKLASLPLLARRTRTSAAWGIDLGSYALKALKLSSDAAGNVKVEDAHYIPLSKPLAHPEAEGERPAIFAAALADLAGRVDLKGSSVAAALSGHQVLGRFFDLPPLPAKKVAAAVEYEARHQIPIDLTELCWGYCELRQIQAAADGPRPIMVLAARRSHAEECANLFESVGIRLASLQGNCLALHNALRFELEPARPSTTAPIAIVDVGGDETNFIVSAPGSAWFRCFGAAGHSFTAALLAEFRLTYNDAEILKRHPAKARRYHRFREALAPPLAQFAGEIDRSLASFRRHSPMSDVARLYAVGGGANLHGLLRQCISGDAS